MQYSKFVFISIVDMALTDYTLKWHYTLQSPYINHIL